MELKDKIEQAYRALKQISVEGQALLDSGELPPAGVTAFQSIKANIDLAAAKAQVLALKLQLAEVQSEGAKLTTQATQLQAQITQLGG